MQFYHGRPCRKCGGTKRYATNRTCVTCNRAAAAKQVAMQTRDRTTWGTERAATTNTYYLVFHPAEFDRLGFRYPDAQGLIE